MSISTIAKEMERFLAIQMLMLLVRLTNCFGEKISMRKEKRYERIRRFLYASDNKTRKKSLNCSN